MQTKATTKEAYELIHKGALAFARAERQGFRVDVNYCKRKTEFLTKKIEYIENKKFKNSKIFTLWKKQYGRETNINSNQQLADILYSTMGVKISNTTKTGGGSTDIKALTKLQNKIPELKYYLEAKKLKKIRDTYLGSFLREQTNGVLHPFLNLHTTVTFRPCIAKGTKILVMKNFKKQGIPIEKVKEGDYVYCFDDDLNPTIEKVKWAGKTGFDYVVRVHWSSNRRKGYLDVTPEHLIRILDGSYVEAQKLSDIDLRKKGEDRHIPKRRVLACYRRNDELVFTNHNTKSNRGFKEHRFIWEHFKSKLKKEEIIHHRNGNHLDHRLKNLKKMTLSKHSKYHALNAPEETIKRRVQGLLKGRKNIIFKTGVENPISLKLTKIDCLRLLIKAKGSPTKVKHDFRTFKKYLDMYSIDFNFVKLRYDKNGELINKNRLKKLSKLGRAKVKEILGRDHYSTIKLYKYFGINTKRRWANQFGEFKPDNHTITKVEWINRKKELYDICTDKYHNFFANEICVHNSTSNPNLANIPKRDEESKKICRKALFARHGNRLLEVDFSGIEVNISACYHQDPQFIHDITVGDMHRDEAIEIFFIKNFDKSKHKQHKRLRDATKNSFVFPQFYGDYYINNAIGLCSWVELPKGKWKGSEGIIMPDGDPIASHLIKNKIKSYEAFENHLKKIEEDFWKRRFKVYNKWRIKWVQAYQKKGYFDMLTGFRCQGVMTKNEVTNYPIQGAAFHCLLWSFIKVDEIQQKEKWNSKLINQIYDAMILDVNPKETEKVSKTIYDITTHDLQKEWPWIIVPLKVEADITDIDGSWADKKSFNLI